MFSIKKLVLSREKKLRKSIINVILIIIIIGLSFFTLLNHISNKHLILMEKQKKDHLIQLVSIARNSISDILGKFNNKHISKESAINEIRNIVRKMVYNDDYGENYIFMSSYDGIMLVQPYGPDTELSDKWDLQDVNGKYIIRDLVNTAKNSEEGGFSTYYYYPPLKDTPEEKISYVLGIPELNCYIGTGCYMGKLRIAQFKFRQMVILGELIFLVFLFILVSYVLNQIISHNKKLENEIEIRTKSENELKILRNYLKNIIDSMPSMLIGVDRNFTITQWNNKTWQETGISYDEAINRNFSDVMKKMSEKIPYIEKAIFSKETVVFNAEKRIDKNGNPIFEDITIYPILDSESDGAVIKVENVTEKVQIEKALIQSEKLTSIAGLAAGMAHEINNPLAAIASSIFNIKRRLTPDNRKNLEFSEKYDIDMNNLWKYLEERDIIKFLDGSIKSISRASDIVKNMLMFSRKSEIEFKYENIVELIENAINLGSIDYDIKKSRDFKYLEIERDYEKDLPPVKCCSSEIEQTFLNIFRNGLQAMEEIRSSDYKPKFTIRLKKETGFIRIEIQNNGPEMSDTVKKRIFEPFFTTKSPGTGTGLGMSISYSIITSHHSGTLSVVSEKGKGTNFIIRLPI